MLAPTLSEDEGDDEGADENLAWDDSAIQVTGGGTPVTGSFVPAIGGPFSALTPSMWPQDILSWIQQVSEPFVWNFQLVKLHTCTCSMTFRDGASVFETESL